MVTRFSLQLRPGHRVHLDGSWLDTRVELLERWCMPSIRSQSELDFTWLLLLDQATPAHIVERVRKVCAEVSRSVVHLSSAASAAACTVEAIASEAEGLDVVVTSRLDSDDAIGRQFVEDVQTRVGRPGPYYIRMTRGLVLDGTTGETRALLFEKSPFLSLVEPVTTPIRSVYWKSHTEIPAESEIIEVDRNPSWLQVVHGGNVLNHLRGERYSGRGSQVLLSDFGIDPPEEMLLRDQVTELRQENAILQNQLAGLWGRREIRLADTMGGRLRRLRFRGYLLRKFRS